MCSPAPYAPTAGFRRTFQNIRLFRSMSLAAIRPARGSRRRSSPLTFKRNPMTGSAVSSAGLDARRRRILFRAWRRGMREMDLVMGNFADLEIAAMSEADLDEFERLLETPDPEALAWITGEAPT